MEISAEVREAVEHQKRARDGALYKFHIFTLFYRQMSRIYGVTK